MGALVEGAEGAERVLVFPFAAIVGMDKAKLALMTVATDPTIGGVLLSGDKGTGKSTLVRAFADVLPEIPVVKGCPFNCNPYNPLEMCDNCYSKYVRGEELEVVTRKMRVVNLPLNVTADRLVGTIDVKKVLTEGVRAFQPGLLAEANRNILYIDEVNLLDDYIADLLLDAAALGWNIVEREGISFKHPARFILVGSMNPEEGELRPQLLDRFGLYVPVEAVRDPEMRAEIVRRVEEFHRDPVSFCRKWEPEQERIREKVRRARELLPKVEISNDLLKLLAETIVEMGIKTHRAEIVTAKVAKAIAALDGRIKVSLEDLKKAMELALPHRIKSKPFEKPNTPPHPKLLGQGSRSQSKGGQQETGRGERASNGGGSQLVGTYSAGSGVLKFDPVDYEGPLPGRAYGVEVWDGLHRNGRGSRAEVATVIGGGQGRAVTYTMPKTLSEVEDIDVFATINAAALREMRLPLRVDAGDFRVKVRRRRVPCLTAILLDCSGSMSVRKRMSVAKGITRKLIESSYVRRDYITLIAFRGHDAEVVIPPTRKYEVVYDIIDELPTGGRTPLPAALSKLLTIARAFRVKYRDSVIRAILITDGKANVPLDGGSVKDELMKLANILKKYGVVLDIYDTRPRDVLDPSPSYIDLLAEVTGSHVFVV